MDSSYINPGAWDCHVHLFDPSEYPYKSDRVYTPKPASLKELIETSLATHFMIVQASVEQNARGILHHLSTAQKTHPDRKLRGTLLYGKHDENMRDLWSDQKIAELHKFGIRCLRIHGEFGGLSKHTSDIVRDVQTLLRGHISTIARRQNWSISMQLPLRVWASLSSFLEHEMVGITIIAEHCASVTCPMPESSQKDFLVLLEMLKQSVIYIKLGALHRRMIGDKRQAEIGMVEAVQRIADAGPRQLLWGSDWPHVNSAAKGLMEAAFLPVDGSVELNVIRRAMSDEVFAAMLYETPATLFR